MFIKTPLTEIIRIDSVYTLHCFDYSRNFQFQGETHAFWEMVFIDSGEVWVVADLMQFMLSSGEAFFHRPGEYHKIWANDSFASVVVLTFETQSPSMQYLAGHKIEVNAKQKMHISEILSEAVQTFAEPLDIVDQKGLIKKADAQFGAEQLIKTHLEQLFIDMIRCQNITHGSEAPTHQTLRDNEIIVSRIMQILEDNIYGNIPLDDISKQMNFSKSYLKSQFKSATGCGIHRTYMQMKISLSKKLLSEERYSISEISEMLGFSSIHHFSKAFKQSTGMPPSTYQRSVRKRALL